MEKIGVILFLLVFSVVVFSAENISFKVNFTETGDQIAFPGTLEGNILIQTYSFLYPFRALSNRNETMGSTSDFNFQNLNSYPIITLFDTETQKREKPPSNPWRITGEIGMGFLGSYLALIPIILAWYQLSLESDEEPMSYIVGSISLITLGNALGVFLIGSIGDETGSFWATWLGSFLGIAIGFGLDISIGDGLEPIFALLGLSAGGPIAFNMTRRYKSPSVSGTALVNIIDSGVILAFPSISFKPGSSDNGGFIKTVSLMNISF